MPTPTSITAQAIQLFKSKAEEEKEMNQTLPTRYCSKCGKELKAQVNSRKEIGYSPSSGESTYQVYLSCPEHTKPWDYHSRGTFHFNSKEMILWTGLG